jgi:hypothetical protein
MVTRTRETELAEDAGASGWRTAADVEVFPDIRVDVTSGGPTHTGRSPARLDPAEGPDASASGLFPAAAVSESDAVAVCAAGQDVGGRWYVCIAGIFTVLR